MQTLEKIIQKFFDIKIISFAITGSCGFIVDILTTWILKERVGINPYISHSFGFILAVFNNYILNRYWTFKEEERKTKISLNQFLSFVAISTIGLFFNTIILYLLFNFLYLNFYLSKVLSVMLVFIWNYIANSLITFKFNKQVNQNVN